jgi:molybdate transport system substrate-binding protein
MARVAVAANFLATAEDLARRFEARHGLKIQIIPGASGQLMTQIVSGAPFDVFLSADVERPQMAEARGLAVKGTRFTYALGRLALWSKDARLVDSSGKVLASDRFTRLAVADPKIAPYGVAAMETLDHMKLTQKVRDRIVQGSSIAQALQFVESGAAELGFLALAQVAPRKDGSRWLVPEAFHSPIEQQAVLLSSGANNRAAIEFLKYLRSSEARGIIRKSGYGLV